MIRTQLALLQRELWEHRALYVTPAVIALLASLATITGQATISVFNEAVDVAIIGGSNLGEAERSAAISALMMGIAVLIFMGMWILSIFYTLDSLYAERKDRSILFWRSLPCTDFETVLSKLLTTLIVIPLIAFVAIVITDIVILAIWSIWLMIKGGDAAHLIWSAAPLFDNWLATFIFLFSATLWGSPLIGWFLFVSGFSKRSPFLTAFLPLAILPMLEKIIFGTSTIGETIVSRAMPKPLFRDVDPSTYFSDDRISADQFVSVLDLFDLGGFLTSVELWLGMLVCGLFTTAAIYVRRYRDES